MKKGFTMIELIFVIVILGILSAVAIPRLAATRDDAEVSKAATNVSTIISDISSYYTSQGTFAKDLDKMTNVALTEATGDLSKGEAATGNMRVSGEDCFTVTVTPRPTTNIKVGDLNTDIITIAAAKKVTKNGCKAAQANPQIVKMVSAKFDAQKCKTVETKEGKTSCTKWEPATNISGFPLTGLSVV
ncbi:type II secretion system protein [Campylobacter corcagiensis]|uniref:type II secretion system protein n=1 Tax=Campylobacter corcagiensis TaxID=1448857 RepID=UPI00046E910A|nr:type II secretion system protein [Campylobacter corcagiensis]QKF64049.1 putative type II secretion system protein [Campylobacter corcagiensis]